jgi:hypothetical protein
MGDGIIMGDGVLMSDGIIMGDTTYLSSVMAQATRSMLNGEGAESMEVIPDSEEPPAH